MDDMKFFPVMSITAFAIAVIFIILGVITGLSYRIGILLFICSGALAVKSSRILSGYTFTAWVLVFVGLAFAYPQSLQQWWGFKLTLLIVPLTQIIMFGMGTTLSPSDFSGILLSPWPVILGVLLQFCVMPMVGFLVAMGFSFEGELAVGIVLIGSVSGGVASNLMAFIAGANVALSVTMTVISTFIAPIMTPVLMKIFASRFVEINTLKMMIGVFNIIVIPVVAGLLAHSILYSSKPWARKVGNLIVVLLLSTVLIISAYFIDPEAVGIYAKLRPSVILGGSLIFLITLAKLVISIWFGRPNTWIDRTLPIVSMVGICVILAIIVAQTHEEFLKTGILLIFAAIIHNTVGYSLGYWGAKGFGIFLGKVGHKLRLRETSDTLIDEANCRTIAFEVGMQNGGLATGLAMDVLKSPLAALPPNIFGTWMNISGSMLANKWKRKNFHL